MIDNNILTKVEPPPVNTEADEAIAQADIQDTLRDASNLDKPAESDESTPKDKTSIKAPRTASVDSEPDESDESDDSSESDDGLRIKAVRMMARKYDSKTLLAAYRKSTKKRHTPREKPKHQGLNLVQGLMDYVRVLEKRMGKLEANAGLDSAQKQVEMDISPNPIDDNEPVVFGARFYNSVKYGDYVEAHGGTQRGTYMCDWDHKYLIRVLYSWVNEDKDQPSDNAISEAPPANDINILVIGIQSEPITIFFEKVLHVNMGTSHLIRLENPFKAVIRNFRRIKEQLLKLETNFGSVAESAQPNTPEAKSSHEDSDPLSISPDQEDNVEAFEKPAALPHFQSFVAFVDQYLGKEIKLFNRFREAKEERVAFENLWMLFESRDTIYCPLREVGQDERFENIDGFVHQPIRRHTPQAYRVIATTGGTLLTNSLTSTKEKKVVSTSIAPAKVGLPGLSIRSEVIAPLVPNSTRIRRSYNELCVYCFYIDFNGLTYGTVRDIFVFKPYEGELDIRSLQAYPIEYATGDMLSDRGKKFLQLTSVSHKQYEGLTIGSNREEINSSVIVDVKLAFEGDHDLEKQSIEVPKFNSPANFWLERPYGGAYNVIGKTSCSNPWCYDKSCTGNVYNESQRRRQYGDISEIRLVLEEYETLNRRGIGGRKRFRRLMEDKDVVRLLPGALPGFALRNRRWVLLNINLIKDVEQESEWKNLFLPPGHQEMVQAMVQGMVETHTKGMDLVRGKGNLGEGKGCIILLHGVPGVGKTSTAECVAAHTKKPLYPITCGDIGYNAEDVERNMETHFKLAHRWGCVLLLDEADVFLAKRDQKDVQRNGLVSVFLRILEYYSGILFLTTNRVGGIDDAFRSRLHLTLYYPKLTKDQTNEILAHNFTRIADINIERKKKKLPPFEYADTEDEILKWAKKNYKTLGWNGRQIRNAFQTVLALSEFQARGKKNKSKNPDKQANPVVKLRYFMVVANAATQFNEYLKATHGYDEDRVAKRDFIRAVEFSPKSNPLLTETEDSSDQDSDEGDSDESDFDQSRNKDDQDHSDDSDSDHEKNKKKKSNSKAKKTSSSKSVTKKIKKVKDNNVESGKKSKDKKKKKEKGDTSDSE
ncbi:hypothetical protein F4782DRAFT_545533 [Xylaria castorea]|nr:hypothetical protein F4782DRAFT_545533 [Xylaria castorea]